MRCDYCPLSNHADTCPEAEGEYGIEYKDGVCGCRHPWNWVTKRDMMYTDALGEMGLDIGIEMDFAPEELERVTEICKHMVGLDYERPYHRHGKAFYRAYRNYYEDVPGGETDFWINCQSAYSPYTVMSVGQHIISHQPGFRGSVDGLEW